MKLVFWVALTFISATSGRALAEETKSWAHESEASAVTVSGNTSSETYAGKQKTSYKIDASELTATGMYLQGKSSQKNASTGVTTSIDSRIWNAGLRYDFNFLDNVGAFVGQSAESDENGGYTQRDNSDIGAKYLPIKDETKSLQTELGYRYTKTNGGGAVAYSNFLRIYLEFNYNWSKDVSFKVWGEHLPNLKDSDKYLSNGEASMSVALSNLFSIKSAYLLRYHNFASSVDDKRTDVTFTTALVAKF